MLQNCPPLYLQWDVYKYFPQPESFPISHSGLVPHSLPFWFYNWVTQYLWRCNLHSEVAKKSCKEQRDLPGGRTASANTRSPRQSVRAVHSTALSLTTIPNSFIVTSACPHVAWETSRVPGLSWEASMVEGDTRTHTKTTDCSVSFLLLSLASFSSGVEHPQRVNS